MNKYNLKKFEEENLQEYIDRASRLSPEHILHYLGKMRSFIYNNMTQDGRRFFESRRRSKLEGKVAEYSLK